MFDAENGRRLLLQAQRIEPRFGFFEYVDGEWVPIWGL